MNVPKITKENKRRLSVFRAPYDQVTGTGSLVPRKRLVYEGAEGIVDLMLPVTMFADEIIIGLEKTKSIASLLDLSKQDVTQETLQAVEKHIIDLRLDHDFEFWSIVCATIQDKFTKQPIPFKLNRPQRRLLAALEKMRVAGVPIRLIILKARQWGGSTLIQMYMAWIQLRLRTSWHSAIIADVNDQAKNIRNMYQRLGKLYPEEAGEITWRPYAGSVNNRIIHQRECIIGIGSAQKPESLRSFDFAMLHLSEVGLWKDTAMKSAADLAQTLQATVPDVADTLVVLESTAKGIGNYFHRQWLNAEKGLSAYEKFFVPWFEIEMYQKEVPCYESFIKTWGEYEWFLWDIGATIEGVYWYVTTKTGYDYDDWRMKSEYPSTAIEAFQSSGQRVFPPAYVEKARKACVDPILIGDVFPSAKGEESLKNPRIEKNDKGLLHVWSLPDRSITVKNRYCIFVDIGGRSEGSDYSVIKVFDRYWMIDGGIPEVAAVWHGHIDQDLLAWKAAQIGKIYSNALLAVESNSLDKRKSDGDHFLTVLDEISGSYDNLYAREDHSKIQGDMPKKYGFHMNTATKPMVINFLNAALRDSMYAEKDERATYEMDGYEIKPNGSYGAIDGMHDDHVIVSAGGSWLCYNMPLPIEITEEFKSKRRPKRKKIQSEATI